ncbi:hypothetical protein NM688_g2736 [Phlebia brevispora]|uniref:Uncharacterized protein n=1 Tax=Phlebia brevispora TaxID=194682 RepID=A0ACC1T847_9APHY|nr:hypothetical protein NM688_g2736 [Phlebia brevispora]
MPGRPKVSTAYIAASANRYPQAADCKGSLVAYGSSTYIALWDTSDIHDRGTYATLPGHEGIVTCIRFTSDSSIVSADDRGVLKIWKPSEVHYSVYVEAKAHDAAISALAVHEDLIVTAGSDSFVKVWRMTLNEPSVLHEIQSIPLEGKYPLSLALTTLPKSQALILAIGSTDRNILIFTSSSDSFVSSATLSGHEDWVKALAFRAPTSANDPLVLASGSQDATIRLWNIESYQKQQKENADSLSDTLSDELLDAFEQSLGDLEDAEEGGRQISLKRHILTVKDETTSQKQFTITFDALLVGHEAGVTSILWRPSLEDFQEQTLLSTSTDSSLILWSPSTVLGSSLGGSTSLWINRQRFGDVGGQRLGGFVGGLWSGNGAEVLGWGWSGGWRRWKCSVAEKATEDLATNAEEWTESGAISGHHDAVKGLAWSPQGEYLISTSLDQTARIHGETYRDETLQHSVWHEIGRPQVHGYDLLRVAFLSTLRFISIADEKVARVFDAPREFVETVKNLKIADIDVDVDRPLAATVPPLGLSNKATNDTPTQMSDLYAAVHRTERRPFEGELAALTLWPETEKVFGHGYELISLAVSPNKRLAATACKATSPEHAIVRIYNTENWQLFGEPLAGHSLTVTGIAFSSDDRYVLTVSRDRSWRLFEHKDTGFVPVAADKSHSRIIWDCCWASEGDVFATASRDKTVKIWHMRNLGTQGKWTPELTIKLPEAATAVAFTPRGHDGRRRLAVGLESGAIHIHINDSGSPGEWPEEVEVPSRLAHIGPIHQLAWRPHTESSLQLASCSEDGTLKVLVVHTEQSE